MTMRSYYKSLKFAKEEGWAYCEHILICPLVGQYSSNTHCSGKTLYPLAESTSQKDGFVHTYEWGNYCSRRNVERKIISKFELLMKMSLEGVLNENITDC